MKKVLSPSNGIYYVETTAAACITLDLQCLTIVKSSKSKRGSQIPRRYFKFEALWQTQISTAAGKRPSRQNVESGRNGQAVVTYILDLLIRR
jgi:hypothetical protein